MAGKGAAPKDPSLLSAKAKRDKPFTFVDIEKFPQPSLESLLGEFNPITKSVWTQPTLLLWSQLADFPTTANLLPAQWSSLARAFMLDDALMSGESKIAPEARIRMAKYGIDPDDFMRMRVKVNVSDSNPVSPKALGGARKTRLLKVVGGLDGKESNAS